MRIRYLPDISWSGSALAGAARRPPGGRPPDPLPLPMSPKQWCKHDQTNEGSRCPWNKARSINLHERWQPLDRVAVLQGSSLACDWPVCWGVRMRRPPNGSMDATVPTAWAGARIIGGAEEGTRACGMVPRDAGHCSRPGAAPAMTASGGYTPRTPICEGSTFPDVISGDWAFPSACSTMPMSRMSVSPAPVSVTPLPNTPSRRGPT